MRYLSALLLIVFLLIPVYAEVVPWADDWTNAAYYSTNGERNNFNSFNIRSEGRFGVHLIELAPGVNLDPYVVYQGIYSTSDPNYWNNQLAWGAGVRACPFAQFVGDSWANEWVKDIKLFVEVMSLSFLKDEVTAQNNNVKPHDTRFGMDLWHEWNLKDINTSVPWNEMWANLSFRETNLTEPEYFNRTYLLYVRNRLGLHLTGGLRPYLVTDLTYAGNDKAWYNSLYYGAGARVEPFREAKDSPEILRKFKMFIEILGVSWLKDKDSRPTSDLRFGVDFTFGK
jgi:hypothetical protein